MNLLYLNFKQIIFYFSFQIILLTQFLQQTNNIVKGPLGNQNCTQQQVYGIWIVKTLEPIENTKENLQCPTQNLDQYQIKELQFNLTYPNRVISNDGQTGYFTMDYTKQISINMPDYKYLIQFTFLDDSSQCNLDLLSYGYQISQQPNKKEDIKCLSAQLLKQFDTEQNYTYTSVYQQISQNSSLPQNFTWTNINNQSYVPTNIKQNNADCYIFATLKMVMARDQIQKQNPHLYDDDQLSAQYILDCNYMTNGSKGGMIQSVIDFGQIYGFIRDSQYQSYTGDQQQCKYTSISPENRIFVNNMLSPLTNYEGKINTVYEIQKEIISNGPVTALINFSMDYNYRNDPCDRQNSSDNQILQFQYPYYYDGTHYLLIAGWYTNTTDQRIYWIVQDSKFEDGIGYVLAGSNAYGIETYINTVNIINNIEYQQNNTGLSTLDIVLIVFLCIFFAISIVLITVLIIEKINQKQRGYTEIIQ